MLSEAHDNSSGAGDSDGRTSWTGNGEKGDYMSVVSFLVHYLGTLSEAWSDGPDLSEVSILLAGYSYGSLVLSSLPPLQTILQPSQTAPAGTSAAEGVLRARRLARETIRDISGSQHSVPDRGRHLASNQTRTPSTGRPRVHSQTVTVGGEETDPSERRLSRDSKDSRRGLSAAKKAVDVPHRIKLRLVRSRSSSKSEHDPTSAGSTSNEQTSTLRLPHVYYMLISPLLPPLAHVLMPPHSLGSLLGSRYDKASGSGFAQFISPTFVAWGTNDSFTSSKRLSAWVEQVGGKAPGVLFDVQIDGAGHFWRETGVLEQLQQKIVYWIGMQQ